MDCDSLFYVLKFRAYEYRYTYSMIQLEISQIENNVLGDISALV